MTNPFLWQTTADDAMQDYLDSHMPDDWFVSFQCDQMAIVQLGDGTLHELHLERDGEDCRIDFVEIPVLGV